MKIEAPACVILQRNSCRKVFTAERPNNA